MGDKTCLSLLLVTAFMAVAPGPAHPQENEELAAAAAAVLERMDQLESLTAIQESLAAVSEEIDGTEREIRRATNDEERQAAEAALAWRRTSPT